MKDETLKNISNPIREFLQEHYLFGYGEEEFSDDASLLEHGILDSLGILEIIAFIESEFDIKVPDEEILPENFDSVEGISRYIMKRLGGPGL